MCRLISRFRSREPKQGCLDEDSGLIEPVFRVILRLADILKGIILSPWSCLYYGPSEVI